MTHMNHLKTVIGTATLALTLVIAPSAFSQQQGGTSSTEMMNRCAQMRQQAQQSPGAQHPPEMQQMMAQCDQMDRTNSNSGTHPGQQAPSPQR